LKLSPYALLLSVALGCASYQGSARGVSESALAHEAGWSRLEQVELVRQKGTKDCGAAALSTVLRYWDPALAATLDRDSIDAALRESPAMGLSARDLRDYARRHGFSAYVLKGSFSDLTHEIQLGRPVIVGVHKPLSSGEALAHYEVVIGFHADRQQVLTLDPAHGLRQNDVQGFAREWLQAGQVMLVIMPGNRGTPRTAASKH
jgi:predicted double-glycine peptidase